MTTLSRMAAGVALLTVACERPAKLDPPGSVAANASSSVPFASPSKHGSSPTTGADAPPATSRCPDVPLDGPNVHYVCDCAAGADARCRPGDDSASGRSPAQPLRTLERARRVFAKLPAGGVVALCRGGAFAANQAYGQRWVNARCRRDAVCAVRDYRPPWAEADAARPIVTADASVSRAFSFDDGGPASHEEGYVFSSLDVHGAGVGTGFFFYNDIDDVTLCGLRISGFKLGVHVAGSNPPEPGSRDSTNARIALRDSEVTNNAGQGYLGACDDCAVLDTRFDNNGFAAALYNHNIYIDGGAHRVSKRVRVIGNDLRRAAVVDGRCAGVSLVVHGKHDGLRIERNRVRERAGAVRPECWGIAVDTGYRDRAEVFENVVVRENTVINPGRIGIGLNGCRNCTIAQNVVVQTGSIETTAIAVPNRARDSDDSTLDRATVADNAVFFGPDARGVGIAVGGEGSHHVVADNAVHYAGNSRSWACLELDRPDQAYERVDANICFFPNGGRWSASHATLEAWRAARGFGRLSKQADPAFRSIVDPFDLTRRQ